MPKFTVAICGGGVGGLACAVALSRYPDIQVDIYEAASQFAEVGAGVGVWPRAWKVVQALGLDRELAQVAVVAPDHRPRLSFNFRKGDQPEGHTFYQLYTPGGLVTIHRPEFQHILLRHLSPSARTHTSKRLASYSQSSQQEPQSRVTLYFEDGSSATCDVLIGADGVKSATRASLVDELAQAARAAGRPNEADSLRRMAQARWSGLSAYRTTITAEALRSRMPGHTLLHEPMAYFGHDRQLTAYPLLHGKIINVAAFKARYDLEGTTMKGPWVTEATKDEIAADFDGWEPEVKAIFQCITKVSRWAVHTTEPLPSFISGRVALIGDSAHASVPFQGAGAGQAIEDAYLLATLLGHPKTTLSTLARALQIYDAVRRPYAQNVAETSRECGMLFTFNYPGLSSRDIQTGQMAEKLRAVAETIQRKWSWAWDSTLDGDLARAVRMLEPS
ncbi:salicylate hydroxylase [Daedalea quercina L-15889]|uniref:Salicylate hydroxylase n=1 Tax=Daedalea quercina L-15889 TaxID=1314783 RepID=A0A165LGT4_9APHY|nr:salicylate hydroxylase [Daedalea quercina L-15889]